MDSATKNAGEMEEKLREYACIGDQLGVENLVLLQMVNVNSKNKVNDWTALHWAAKRGHAGVAEFLLKNGADAKLKTDKGKTPLTLATNESVRSLLKMECEEDQSDTEAPLPIVPSYISHPQFPYTSSSGAVSAVATKQTKVQTSSMAQHLISSTTTATAARDNPELVLRVRVANDQEKDFIEVEMDKATLSFKSFVLTMCRELQVQASTVYKIRKLPNTIVRKDKDVWRLTNFQEIELVLTGSRDPTTVSTGSIVINETNIT